MKHLLIALLLLLDALPLTADSYWVKVSQPDWGLVTCWKDIDGKNMNHGYMEDPMFCAVGTEKTPQGKVRGFSTTIKHLMGEGWQLVEVILHKDEMENYLFSKAKP